MLELHAQELKMPHAMIMQDFGEWSKITKTPQAIFTMIFLVKLKL